MLTKDRLVKDGARCTCLRVQTAGGERIARTATCELHVQLKCEHDQGIETEREVNVNGSGGRERVRYVCGACTFEWDEVRTR